MKLGGRVGQAPRKVFHPVRSGWGAPFGPYGEPGGLNGHFEGEVGLQSKSLLGKTFLETPKMGDRVTADPTSEVAGGRY